jgi:hypothetical protein
MPKLRHVVTGSGSNRMETEAVASDPPIANVIDQHDR